MVLAGFGPDGQPDAGIAGRVAECWAGGGLVGLPTETVYGLSADADNCAAVARIYRVKGRPAGHPLIVHVAGPAAIAQWSTAADPRVLALAATFWPGPLTVVLARSSRAGDHITGGQPTVALRCPGHPVALAAIEAFAALSGDPGAGVAAPSANRFGRVSPTSAADVVAELADRLDPGDLVVDGGRCSVGVESTIVDLTGDRPRLLRPGALGLAEIVAAWEGLAGAGGALIRKAPEDLGVAGEARVPGMLAAHYAPTARVLLVAPSEVPWVISELRDGRSIGLLASASVADVPGWQRLAAPADPAQYASSLYGALRRADDLGLGLVLAVLPDGDDPLSAAVRDRLARAATGSGTDGRV